MAYWEKYLLNWKEKLEKKTVWEIRCLDYKSLNLEKDVEKKTGVLKIGVFLVKVDS